MKRKDDWDIELSRSIRKHGSMAMQWGVSDCLTFPRDCVFAMTGKKLFPKSRYTTEFGAAKAMKSLGFDNIGDLVASVLPECPKLLAGRGDVVVVSIDATLHGGIVTASGVAVKSQVGMIYLPFSAIVRAFKV
jgi:hypothetical protein